MPGPCLPWSRNWLRSTLAGIVMGSSVRLDAPSIPGSGLPPAENRGRLGDLAVFLRSYVELRLPMAAAAAALLRAPELTFPVPDLLHKVWPRPNNLTITGT